MRWLAGWLAGWLRCVGGMGGWVDGWMGGWVDGWMGGWVDGWMGGWADRRTQACIHSYSDVVL